MRINYQDLEKIKRLAGDAKTVSALIGDANNVGVPANAAFFLKKILDNFDNPAYVKQLRILLKTLESASDSPISAGKGSVFIGGSVEPGTTIITGNGNIC